MSNEFRSYGTFEHVDKGSSETHWAVIAPTSDEIKTTIQLYSDPDYKSEPNLRADLAVDVDSEVGRGIWNFYSKLKSYYEVTSVTSAIPNVLSYGYFKSEIEDYAKNNLAIVETFQDKSIYGMNEIEQSLLTRRLDKWREISEGLQKLPAALLLSLVAGFDSAFADFAKTLLKSKPERYSGSDRQYSISDILKLESLEQLINKAADDEIDQLMNKSHIEQISFFEKSFDISIKDHYSRWPQFIEIFERRNLAAHGSLVVNDRYLQNCKKAGKTCVEESGSLLKVDGDYLQQSIDILIEFSVLLALAAWQKQYPKSIPESFGAIIEVSYSLLKDGHPEVALRVLEYGLKVKGKGADEQQIKMMIINLAIAHKQSGDEGTSNKVLESGDWSAVPPKFKICVAAIKGEIDQAISFLEAAKISDNLSLWEIREWPAFQWARKDDLFKSGCEKVFGEPLFPTRVVADDPSSTL